MPEIPKADRIHQIEQSLHKRGRPNKHNEKGWDG